ncbi:unnamed protein product [Oikopleura dioica]|uniref:type I protein arginine methyltransferase n=2 Tax=Oikopleura dioica TaxID=34765 RepID=E4WQU8_OIKDI|nr:unnamed protein product [Oikopleura dioica]
MSNCESESDWSDAPELEEDETTICRSLFSLFEGSVEECLASDKRVFGWSLEELNIGEYDFIKVINYCRAKKFTEAPSKAALEGELKTDWDKDEFYKPVLSEDPFLMHQWTKDEDFMADNKNIKSTAADQSDVKRRQQEIQKLLEDTEIGQGRLNDGYFDSYADYGIHAEMLQDKARTEAYRNVILKNPHLFKDKVVVDVGCGTGILSMFAAQAGAKIVYALEMSEIAFDAIDVVRENGLADKVKIIKGKAEEIAATLPKADVVISEWMGYCCLYEGMLDTVLEVRDKVMKHGGHMMPGTAGLDFFAVSSESLWHTHRGFWDNVYGFKMKSLKARAHKESKVLEIKSSEVVSPMERLIEWNLNTCTKEDLSFSKPLYLESNIDGELHGIGCSFDCDMVKIADNETTNPYLVQLMGVSVDKSENAQETFVNVLSTSPYSTLTHWKQTFFMFEEPVKVTCGSAIEGTVKISRRRTNDRELEVFLKLECNGAEICNRKYSVS